MILDSDITAWGTKQPWPTRSQVEQDLILSRLIVEIADHSFLGRELIFRGGTCLHKLHLPVARRYSEDLDYVRFSAGGIGPVTSELIDLVKRLGFEVKTRIGQHPKVYFRTRASDGGLLRVKIEINTYERQSALLLQTMPYRVASRWFTGQADVLTFAVAEMSATKIRALYQRKKGRDLFDLWLILTELNLDPQQIMDAFGPYRPEGLTAQKASSNLRQKVADADFRADLSLLVNEWPRKYSIDAAAELVTTRLHRLL